MITFKLIMYIDFLNYKLSHFRFSLITFDILYNLYLKLIFINK
jgi:hypothetical protein